MTVVSDRSDKLIDKDKTAVRFFFTKLANVVSEFVHISSFTIRTFKFVVSTTVFVLIILHSFVQVIQS